MVFYTPDHIALKCSVAKITVYRWIRNKQLKAAKIGGVYRIKKTDFEEFVKEHYETTTNNSTSIDD